MVMEIGDCDGVGVDDEVVEREGAVKGAGQERVQGRAEGKDEEEEEMKRMEVAMRRVREGVGRESGPKVKAEQGKDGDELLWNRRREEIGDGVAERE
ncbi:hypothetical protein CDL15_Pgr011921 [Punica granatum]|uniref:Uncharacterized protein n=1 Tax=Punica granatum TaxID=22663 RepID=A0A218WCC4_PUNGR|nr:hypothetical protein CDL15_Pgr011921 [Punica granatum]